MDATSDYTSMDSDTTTIRSSPSLVLPRLFRCLPSTESPHRRRRAVLVITLLVAATVIVAATVTAVAVADRRPGLTPTPDARPSPSGKFLHLSDIHLDPLFNESLGRSCFCNAPGKSMDQAACAAGATSNRFGARGCDAPLALLQATLDAAAAAAPPEGYDFVLITGDYTRHHTDRLDDPLRDVPAIIKTVVGEVALHFPATAVHHSLGHHQPGMGGANGGAEQDFVLGNNDFTADYRLNVTTTPAAEGGNAWFSMLAPLFGDELTNGGGGAVGGGPEAPLRARDDFAAGGYFMHKVHASSSSDSNGGLYIISLNTVVYSPSHNPTPLTNASRADPFGQLQWFRRALGWLREQQKQQQQQQASHGAVLFRALVVGHIPPTQDHYAFEPLWEPRFVDAYLQIVGEFDDVIAAQLYGHTHCDTFRLMPRFSAAPAAAPAAAAVSSTQPLFITSAMTPIFQNNPSFRVWDWDPAPVKAADDTLLDYTVYTAALDRNGPQRLTGGALVFEPQYVEEGRERERGGERRDVDDLFCVYDVVRSVYVCVCMRVARDGYSSDSLHCPFPCVIFRYTAKSFYGVPSLGSAAWQDGIAQRLGSDDTLWRQYVRGLWAGAADTWQMSGRHNVSSPLFRKQTVCAIEHMRFDDFEACVAARSGGGESAGGVVENTAEAG